MVMTKFLGHGQCLRFKSVGSYSTPSFLPHHLLRASSSFGKLAETSSLGARSHAPGWERKASPRRRRGYGTLLAAGITICSVYIYDRQYNYSTLTRNLRAVSTFAVVTVDNQTQRLLGEYGDAKKLRERNAERFFKMFKSNGGIYQKIGQGIALQSTTMPPELRAKFATFYDDCPSVSLNEVAEVLRQEFDIPSTASSPEAVLDSLFAPGSFESEPVGSASIAQVHKACLKDTGDAVAVKIQKPAIEQQIRWDLWVFSYALETSRLVFQMPHEQSADLSKDHDIFFCQGHPFSFPCKLDRFLHGSGRFGD